jgi:hypothetical protein
MGRRERKEEKKKKRKETKPQSESHLHHHIPDLVLERSSQKSRPPSPNLTGQKEGIDLLMDPIDLTGNGVPHVSDAQNPFKWGCVGRELFSCEEKKN